MNAPLTSRALGYAKALATRRAEKAKGMAFARAWRERNRGRDWTLPANPIVRPVCAHCQQVIA